MPSQCLLRVKDSFQEAHDGVKGSATLLQRTHEVFEELEAKIKVSAVACSLGMIFLLGKVSDGYLICIAAARSASSQC